MPRRPADIQPRLILGLHGLPKTGKTLFCLSAPEPIKIINTDFGVDEKFAEFPSLKRKDIEIEDIAVAEPGNHESAQRALAQFHEQWMAWVEELGRLGTGTLIIDNATFLWGLVQLVKLEEAKRERFKNQSKVKDIEDLRDQRFDYGPVNAYMGAMLRQPYRYPGVNMILTHDSGNKYVGGTETAEIEYKGFKWTPSIVQAMVQTMKVDSRTFRVLVEKSRYREGEVAGLYLDGDAANFTLLRELIVGDGQEGE